jgi:hypothetical protein
MHGPINVKLREGTAVICLKHQVQPCKILVSGKLVQWDLCATALYESDTKHLINMNKAETSTYAGAALLRRVHKITKKKSGYWFRHVCPSVRLHGTSRLPLDGFS